MIVQLSEGWPSNMVITGNSGLIAVSCSFTLAHLIRQIVFIITWEIIFSRSKFAQFFIAIKVVHFGTKTENVGKTQQVRQQLWEEKKG